MESVNMLWKNKNGSPKMTQLSNLKINTDQAEIINLIYELEVEENL